MQLTTTVSDGAPFTGQVDSGDMGPVRICRIAAFPHGSDRLNYIRGASVAPFYKIVFQRAGTLRLEQDDRRTVIGPGHWCVYDVSRPYSIVNLDTVDQRAMLFAKDAVPDNLTRVLRLLVDRAFPMSGVSHVLMDCLSSTLEQFDSVPAAAADTLGESLFELARMALVEQMGGHDAVPVSETMRERVKTYVRRNLADPHLSVDMIAATMGCSKRYLHKVFNDGDQTLGDFIRECRLERCCRDLADPGMGHRTITEIAFDWGFNNFSHFSQVFKTKYGVSPRTYRNTRLTADRRLELH